MLIPIVQAQQFVPPGHARRIKPPVPVSLGTPVAGSRALQNRHGAEMGFPIELDDKAAQG